jgi:hypothetical protein
MLRREVALLLGIAAGVAAVPAGAGADFPVTVVVVGHGEIRVRLAAGRVSPCDSHENRILFDGWVGPGTYRWWTSSDFVCFQHTSGALREQDWSMSRLIATAWRKKPAEIQVSTDDEAQ